MLALMRHTAVLGLVLGAVVTACGDAEPEPTPVPTDIPESTATSNNRGVAYEKLGKQELAKRNFAKARELGYEYE